MPKQKTKIPEWWKEVRLDEIAKICTGKKDVNEGSSDGQYPFFSCSQEILKSPGYSFDAEALLIAGNCGFNVKYYKGKFEAYQRTYVIENKGKNNLKFLYYVLSQGINRITENNQGSTIKYIKIGDLLNFKILLPPLATQNKIAEILGAVDGEIEKVENIIQSTAVLLKGAMKKLLNIGNDLKIGSVCIVNPVQVDPRKKENEIFKYIDIASIVDFKITEIKNYLGSEAPSRARRVVKNNDILISTVRPNLKAFTILKNVDENNLLCSTGFCVLRAKKEFDCNYLYYKIIDDNFVKYLVNKTTGSNYPSVSASDISEYKTKFPDFEKQKKMAEILLSIDEKISIYQKIKNNLAQLKKGLMGDLLGGMKIIL